MAQAVKGGARRRAALRRASSGTTAKSASARRASTARSKGARPRLLLAGDVGGTKTNIALFEARPDRVRLVDAARYPSREHADLREIVEAFLSERQGEIASGRISAAAFGIAGPVLNGRSHTTNLPWLIDARVLSRLLGFPAVLVNDLAATAWALPEIDPGKLATLQEGPGIKDGTLALIAAGTGLGEAFVLRDGGRFLVGATEGGHSDYPARTDEEIDLLRFLRARFGHVSLERVVSGPGVVNIDDFLGSREPAPGSSEPRASGPSAPDIPRTSEASPDPAAEIARAALSGRSARAAHALRLFVAAYGAEAGNLALKCFATGGVYLGGGIAPKILPALEEHGFLDAFRDKGRFRDFLASIPVRVILDDQAALLGAARVARTLTER